MKGSENMFHPGETVRHCFIIPFAKANITQIIVSYKQNDYVILERKITSTDENTFDYYDDPAKTKFHIELTQNESLLFEDKTDFTIQLNVFTDMGSRHASCELKGSNGVQHHREVITND